MDINNLIKNINKFKKDNKGVNPLFILFILGILLITFNNFFLKSTASTKEIKVDNKETKNKEDDSENYEETIQKKLKDTLEKIEGVGKVELLVYFESGEEQVPALNINDSVSNTEERDNQGGVRHTTQKNNGSSVVITNDTEGATKPLIVKKKKPKVTGVFIVAEGAENKIIELQISKAVVDLFDLNESKVNVYPMKK